MLDVDLRKVIKDAVEAQRPNGRSLTWLCKEMARRGVCSERHAWRYLSGEQDATGEILGEMLDALNLSISRGEQNPAE